MTDFFLLVINLRDQLKRNYNIGQYWLEVKLEDIIQYDEELFGKIKEYPSEFASVVCFDLNKFCVVSSCVYSRYV